VRTGVFQKILFGIGLALALYGFFFYGNIIFRSVLPETSAFIDSVYALRTDHSQVILILLLVCVIGPGEELIWRGYIQHHVGLRRNPRFALIVNILLYTLAHIPSGNPMLLVAALLCGVTWSLAYYVSGSLLINVVSHALWDVMVFILFPLK
jgi:membrane protease YdiL (CAAX protease family)